MNDFRPSHLDLQAIAKQVMLAHGFEPDFPPPVAQQLAALKSTGRGSQRRSSRSATAALVLDRQRHFARSRSDRSRRTAAQRRRQGADRNRRRGCLRPQRQSPSTSTPRKKPPPFTPACAIFSMLPEELSTGTTSLLENEDRLSVVIEFVSAADGARHVQRRLSRHRAQQGAAHLQRASEHGLKATGPAPAKVAASTDLQAQLKLQDEVAQALKQQRYQHGALNLETSEVRPVMLNRQGRRCVRQEKNPRHRSD